ncbi:MAG: shikimate dehydrogenase [Solirubrobacteraceae bacterium]
MTRRVALIGKPLRRRHSKVMHDAAFDANGIDARYELREIDADQLPAFVEEVRDPAWFGFQVTAPYKREIMALLDEVESQAAAIGAVNSVERRHDGALVGFNTDAPGFAAAVRRDLGREFSRAKVVVVGAGGAARAAVRAAIDGAAAEVLVSARRREAAQELAAEAGAPAVAIALDDPALSGALQAANLVVNATTVGMLDPGTPIDPQRLGPQAAVFDLVYVPPETELTRATRARGLPAANGAEMLVAQAEIAFERWTGVAGTADVMRSAVAPLIVAGGAA